MDNDNENSIKYINNDMFIFDGENYEKIIKYLTKYTANNYSNDYFYEKINSKNFCEENMQEFYKLLDRFIHLISIHQMAMDNCIHISGNEIIKVKERKNSGLSDKEYEEMKKIVERLKELQKNIGKN